MRRTGGRVALQGNIDPSAAYQTWEPSTLQVPFQMFYTTDESLKEIQTMWETAVADLLVNGRYPHAASLRASVIVEAVERLVQMHELPRRGACPVAVRRRKLARQRERAR